MNAKPIPILDLKAQYAAINEEIKAAIVRVLDSQQFILGPEVEALEKVLAEYCKCSYAFGVSSGTDALLLSLMAVGVKPGDEVITTPYSFFATSGSIVRLGATPVYVDIDPATFNIMADQIETRITKNTKVILPVHLAGQVSDMGPIVQVAKQYGLKVIEDACQAIGSDYKGNRAGSIGDIGCFSFFPSKNLGGYGDSGRNTKIASWGVISGWMRFKQLYCGSNSNIWRIGRRPGVNMLRCINGYSLKLKWLSRCQNLASRME
jgi:dTDP-4-amino-4,6-dideoxygalactose transaminase